MITTNAFPEECNKLPQHYHLKNAFHNISFQTAIGFHKYFQCHGLLCNRVAIFIIRGWVFDSASVISSSTFFWFRAFVVMSSRAEKPHLQRYVVTASLDSCGSYSRAVHQNRESGISWKVSRADETFRRSQNWSCNSPRILVITREIENEFCKSATSSSLSQRNIVGTQFQRIEDGLLQMSSNYH